MSWIVDITVINGTSDARHPQYIVSNSIIIPIFTLVLGMSVALLLLRRNHQPLKIRGVNMLLVSCILNFLILLVYGVREWVGRFFFPCFLFTWAISVQFFCITAPLVIRTFRLYFIHTLNRAKMKAFEETLNGDVKNKAEVKKREEETKKEVQRLRFWISDRFLISIYFGTLFAITVVWVLFFLFGTTSCRIQGRLIAPDVFIIPGIAIAGLLIIQFTLLILMRDMQDGFKMRAEAIVSCVCYLVVLVVALTFTLIPSIADRVDRVMQKLYIPYAVMLVDMTISILIPGIATYYFERRKALFEQAEVFGRKDRPQLRDTLYRDKEAFILFKEFCKKEFSLENTLFIEAVSKYSAATRDSQRREIATSIFDRFLVTDAPLALNVPEASISTADARFRELVEVHDRALAEKHQRKQATGNEHKPKQARPSVIVNPSTIINIAAGRAAGSNVVGSVASDQALVEEAPAPSNINNNSDENAASLDSESLSESDRPSKGTNSDGSSTSQKVFDADIFDTIVQDVELTLSDTFSRFVLSSDFLKLVAKREMQSMLAKDSGLV